MPDLGVIPDHWRLVGEGVDALPRDHHLVHPASVQVCAGPSLEVVDEGVNLVVRLSPVEVAVLVSHIAVERGARRVDQPGQSVRYSARIMSEAEARGPAKSRRAPTAASSSQASQAGSEPTGAAKRSRASAAPP